MPTHRQQQDAARTRAPRAQQAAPHGSENPSSVHFESGPCRSPSGTPSQLSGDRVSLPSDRPQARAERRTAAFSPTAATNAPPSSVAEALGRPASSPPPRQTAPKRGSPDGSWASDVPASAAMHESRWSHCDVDYSADPRTRRAIRTELRAARKASDWRAAAEAVTTETREALARQSATARATVAHRSSGGGVAMLFDDSDSPSTGVSLAHRYSAGRQHEVEMHNAVASPARARTLLHPKAGAHASAARRSGAERARQREEQKQSSSRAADWGRDATRANGIGCSAWVMVDRAAAVPVQAAASRKNASSPGFCLG